MILQKSNRQYPEIQEYDEIKFIISDSKKAMTTGLDIHIGDITEFKADAIVNASDAELTPGGGVSGAIYTAAGPEMEREAARIAKKTGGCPTGECRVTGGYNLPAEFCIHCCGPVRKGGNSNEADLLASCYVTALELASEKSLSHIAFPAISAGIFGYPPEKAAEIAIDTISRQLEKLEKPDRVTLVFLNEEQARPAKEILEKKA